MQEYQFSYKSDLDHYVAEAFVLRCFDDRFWKVFKQFLKSRGMRRIDPESVAGGTKVFASPEQEGDRDFMLRELEKSIRLHYTKKVMLFTHHDCGAYGGSAKFGGNEADEVAFHYNEHTKARVIIGKHFPDIAIESYFLDKSGVIKLS